MLQIAGILQAIPVSIQTEAGSLTTGEGQQEPAVILTVNTLQGPVQVILPTSIVGTLVKGLNEASEEAQKQTPHSDLYLPGSDLEVEQIKAAHDQITQGKS